VIVTPRLAAAVIWFLAGMIPFALAVLALLEAVLVLEGQPLVTDHIRNWADAHTITAIAVGMAFVTAIAVGFTHFVLDR